MPVRTIELPYQWTPRPYQIEAYKQLDNGKRYIITVWHRRSGKDTAGANHIARAAHQRIGNYWILFPSARQGRKAFWERIDDTTGVKLIDQAFPVFLRKRTVNDEMFIELKCGSTVQVTGADQADSLVGSNPIGIVMSEYALTSPRTIDFIRPILRINKGWLWINSTPRGQNHLYDLYHKNIDNPEWWCDLKTWQDTGFLTQADIDAEVRSGMSQEQADQEYGCSWTAPNMGVVYSKQLAAARAQGRVGHVPYDDRFPVECWWDVGTNDATAIWFVQRIGPRINLIEYYENKGQTISHYAKVLKERPYAYQRHVGPHDLEQRVWAADGTTKELASKQGIQFTVAPKLRISDGIDAARAMFSRLHFSDTGTVQGMKVLDGYEFEWDDDRRLFSDKPLHNWASHGADALRYGAVTPEDTGIIPAWARELSPQNTARLPKIPTDFEEFDPLGHWRSEMHR